MTWRKVDETWVSNCGRFICEPTLLRAGDIVRPAWQVSDRGVVVASRVYLRECQGLAARIQDRDSISSPPLKTDG